MTQHPFSIAAALGADNSDTGAISANWQALDLPHLLIGEGQLPPHPLLRHQPEVSTCNDDNPRLRDLLQCAATELESDWILLCSSELQFSADSCSQLSQLCRQGAPRRLMMGRAWCHGGNGEHSSNGIPPDQIEAIIDQGAVLDPLERPSWALLPRGLLLDPPAEISCSPKVMLPWLTATTAQLDWPQLEATPIVPCLRHRTAPADPITVVPRAVVLPHTPNTPRLSLLLAAPEDQLAAHTNQLQPQPGLPWEVIARPAEVGLLTAWRDGLEAACGELCWPLTPPLPPLALIPAVMQAFDSPGIDLIALAWSRNGSVQPGNDPYHQEPGCLAAHTAWLKRLLNTTDYNARVHSTPRAPAEAEESLLQLRQRAIFLGAGLHHLPLVARAL